MVVVGSGVVVVVVGSSVVVVVVMSSVVVVVGSRVVVDVLVGTANESKSGLLSYYSFYGCQ